MFPGAAFHWDYRVVVIPLARGSVELYHQHIEIPILGGHIDSPYFHAEHEVAIASHRQCGPPRRAVLGDHFNEIDGVELKSVDDHAGKPDYHCYDDAQGKDASGNGAVFQLLVVTQHFPCVEEVVHLD